MQPQGFEFPAGRRHRLPRVPSNSLRTLPLIESEQKLNYARNGIFEVWFSLGDWHYWFFKSNFPFLKIDYIPIIHWIETWRKTTKPEDHCLSLKQCWRHHKFWFVNVSPCCFLRSQKRARSRGLEPTSTLECLVAATAQLPTLPKYPSWWFLVLRGSGPHNCRLCTSFMINLSRS